MDSYTIGRENFGMEKEFIMEVVQNCPNPACRYYKNQMELTQKTLQHLTSPAYLNESQSTSSDIRSGNFNSEFPMPIPPPTMNSHLGLAPVDLTGQNNLDAKASQQLLERPKSVAPSQQHITAALIQQQNRAIAQQNLDKLNANLEKQRQQMQMQQQLDMSKSQKHFDLPIMEHKLSDFLRANLDNLEGLSSSNKDLLALHNGAWTTAGLAATSDDKRGTEGGQEKIVRAFAEVMKNMQRMKTYVRPAMCKPYGKQSEALQKSKLFLFVTINFWMILFDSNLLPILIFNS